MQACGIVAAVRFVVARRLPAAGAPPTPPGPAAGIKPIR
jgi:hypothetical protein